MKIARLETFSTRLVALREKRAQLHVEISKRKAECAIIRERMQKSALNPGNAQEQRAMRLIGDVL
jgi:hypothetical protein